MPLNVKLDSKDPFISRLQKGDFFLLGGVLHAFIMYDEHPDVCAFLCMAFPDKGRPHVVEVKAHRVEPVDWEDIDMKIVIRGGGSES